MNTKEFLITMGHSSTDDVIEAMLRVADDLADELLMSGSTSSVLDNYRLMVRLLPRDIAFSEERIARIQNRTGARMHPWRARR